MDNFFQGIMALAQDIGLFLSSVLHDKLFLGFVSGSVLTTLVTGLVVSKDPRHIPFMLQYSSAESFQKLAPRDASGMFKIAFVDFIKLYTLIRILFFTSFIAFCIMITVVVLTYKQ